MFCAIIIIICVLNFFLTFSDDCREIDYSDSESFQQTRRAAKVGEILAPYDQQPRRTCSRVSKGQTLLWWGG
jgi:hypothetical protein